VLENVKLIGKRRKEKSRKKVHLSAAELCKCRRSELVFGKRTRGLIKEKKITRKEEEKERASCK